MNKVVYKYINEFINEEELLKELEVFKEENEKHKRSIEKLINDIKEVIDSNKESMIVTFQEVSNLLFNNEVYSEQGGKVTDTDLMLMITEHLFSPNVPTLNQNEFDALVDAAIKYEKDCKENCWRLAINYQYTALDFSKVVNFFIEIRDVWYLVELMHSLFDILNLDEIVEKIIKTNDLIFIERLINDNFLDHTLNKEQIEKLKKVIDK